MSIKSLNRLAAKLSGKVPLRTVLVVPFVIQIFAAVGLTGYLSFRNGQKAVNDLATQLRSEITARIEQNLQTYLATPHQVNQSNATAITLGQLNLQDPVGLSRHFWYQLLIFDSVTSNGFANKQKELLVAERLVDGSLTIRISGKSTGYDLRTYATNSQGDRLNIINIGKNYDPRRRHWYKVAVQSGKPSWSEIYPHITGITLYLGASQPVYDKKGKLEWVLISTLNLLQIGNFLRTLKIGKTGQSFIIERSGMLVATSTTEKPFRINKDKVVQRQEDKVERLKATNSSDLLTKATAKYLAERFGDLNQIQNSQQLDFEIDGHRQLLQVLPFQDNKGLDWLIVVVVPEADFMEQINTNTHITILLCLGALGLATVLGIFTSRWITQPILRLSAASKAIASGELDQKVEVKGVDELGVLAQSFNQMAQQLQESFATLEAKNADLQHLDQLKDEFLANTSHELRTPLNGIIGIAESLIDGATGPLPQQTRSNLATIISSGRRLANLVNDILDYSKLRHKDIELQLKPVGMREIAEVVLTLSRPLIGQKDLQLINAIHPELPPATADENRVQQILYNLVGNAIKFTDRGTVEISAELVTGDWVRFFSITNYQSPYLAITVSDTGIGIPEDKLDCIFESFEQADGSTARQYGGTGLGLAVTKQLVELHGGEIKVESTVGVGSRFTFTLPMSDGQVESRPPQLSLISRQSLVVNSQLSEVSGKEKPTTDSGQMTTDKFKILIVDDEPVNLQVLVNYLSVANYTITQATNGLEALAAIKSGLRPELILLDVMMPRMTGYEVTQKIRETWQANELPIVLVTAKNQVSDLVAGLEAGANDYLTKPVSKDELLARIKTHINIKRLKAENIRLSAELEIARRLQQMLLPKEHELMQIPELDIAGFMEPAAEVGGDYYDVLLHEGRVKIGIGDVTGHGLESGVLMIMVQTAVRTLLANNETDPVRFLNVVNRTIYNNVQRMNSDKILTLSLLDYQDGKLRLSGQHEEIIVVRCGGKLERIDTIDLGFPIGLKADIADFIAQTEVQLHPGDVVVLYTDGITEADNIEKAKYGLERLCELVRLNWQRSASEIKQAVIDDVRRHIGEQKVYDDITIVVFKHK